MNSRCISCGSNTSILWSLLYSSSPSSSSSEPQMGLRKSFLGGSDRSPKNDRTLSIKAELVIANNTGGFQFGFQHGLWILDGLAGWSLIVFTVWLFLQLRNNKKQFSTFDICQISFIWQLTVDTDKVSKLFVSTWHDITFRNNHAQKVRKILYVPTY